MRNLDSWQMIRQMARHIGLQVSENLHDILTPPQLLRISADIFIILFALAAAQAGRALFGIVSGQYSTLTDAPQTIFSADFWFGIPVVVAVCMLSFALSGFYRTARLYSSYYKLFVVARAVTGAYLLIALTSFLAPTIVPVSRSVLIGAYATSLVLVVGSRVWSHLWRRYVIEREQGEAAPVLVGSAARHGSRQRHVLVIGGAGYIGSALVPRLLAQGCRVRVLDLMMYGEQPIKGFRGHPAFELVRGDFRQVDVLVKAMRGVNEVVHLGGLVGDPACAFDEDLTLDINVAATRAVAEVARGAGISRLLFASTCSVYGASDKLMSEDSPLNPVSLYARTKIASERMLLEFAEPGFQPIIVRFATIYGISGRARFDLVVNLLTAKALVDREITVFGGEQWRPFLHVDDAARACAELLGRELPEPELPFVFNVGSNGENYTIRQIGALVKALVPAARLSVSGKDADQRNYRVKFDKIQRVIGFAPEWTVERGIRQVMRPIMAGEVTDYRSPAYSNLQFLTEGGDAMLARPRSATWARDLASDRASDLATPAPGGISTAAA
jgi:nucleoside-diphosphate-sugar epimerase